MSEVPLYSPLKGLASNPWTESAGRMVDVFFFFFINLQPIKK